MLEIDDSILTKPVGIGPELVFGIVGAAGTDLDLLVDFLKELLGGINYTNSVIRVSGLLHKLENFQNLNSSEGFEEERINAHQDAGDWLRENLQNDALALFAVNTIKAMRNERAKRLNLDDKKEHPIPRHAFIIKSLKHPEEVKTLRKIYGPIFYLIGGFAPHSERVVFLAKRIAESHNDGKHDAYRAEAEKIIFRDHTDPEKQKHGQNVRDTFPLSDVFVSLAVSNVKNEIDRFLEIIFGYPFHTPTKEEYGMFHAYAAALRSASLGRQVGAAVLTSQGDVIAVGCNEVPKAGGGLYWCNDPDDKRDFRLREDSNDEMKKIITSELFEKLRSLIQKDQTISTEMKSEMVKLLTNDKLLPAIKGTQIMNVIEFGRAVHAELAALMDAARRGVSIQDSILYSTTFPCHECARHIVAAGIKKVFYLEPYPKSLAMELYPDSISFESSIKNSVIFETFHGISPTKYLQFFVMPERKLEGKIVDWNKPKASPRFVEYHPQYSYDPSYLERETILVSEMEQRRNEKQIKLV